MKLVFFFGQIGALFGLLAGSGLAEETNGEPERIDPVAIEWVEAATNTLARQQDMSVTWFVSFDEIVDGREVITHVRSGDVLLSRGVGYYAYADQEEGAREFFFDRGQLSVHLLDQNAYVQLPFWGTFDELATRIAEEYDTALPIWQVLVSDAGDQILGDVTSAAYLGVKRIAGQDTHHVALSSYDLDLQLWVLDDAENPAPVMMVGTDPYKQGWPQFRAYFIDWEFAPEIPDGAFTFQPGETTSRLAWPKADVTDSALAEGE